MARPKMQKPVNFTASIQTLYEIVASFSDDKSLGQFFRKAVSDLSNGCSTKNVDIRIKSIYDNASKKLATQQNKQKNYNDKRKISSSGKPHGSEATTLNPIHKNLSSEPCLPLNVVENNDKKNILTLLPTDEKAKPAKNRYGTNRHVLLSEEEGRKLRALFGERLEYAIDILDSYIHSLPLKASRHKNGAKYWREEYESKDHYFCMTRWVKETVERDIINETNRKAAEARLKKAESTPKSFAQMERERTARALRGESIDGKNYVKDEDLTIEEFRRKYG